MSPQTQTATKQPDFANLTPAKAMELVLLQPINAKVKAMSEILEKPDWVSKVEELLPPMMKGQAKRLIKRAMLTMSRKSQDYAKVEPVSFVRCVLEAAELGLAIDGRLAHAVCFNNKVKDASGKETWVSQAQLMVDYKGLVAIARRSNIIADCYARLVWEQDKFDVWEQDGVPHLDHRPFLGSANDAGELIGGYAIIRFNDKMWRYEWMPNAEIDSIRGRSKSWTREYEGVHKPSGPWVTDDLEMRKKTILRRALKTYMDDPAFTRAVEIEDDAEYGNSQTVIAQRPMSAMELPTGRTPLRGPPPPETQPSNDNGYHEKEPESNGETATPKKTEPAKQSALDAAWDETAKPAEAKAAEGEITVQMQGEDDGLRERIRQADGDAAKIKEVGKLIGKAREKLGPLYEPLKTFYSESLKEAK